MYTPFMRRDKNKKNGTKNSNPRVISTHPSAPPTLFLSDNSSSIPMHVFRSTSQPPVHSAPYSGVQPSQGLHPTDHRPASPHMIPCPINSPSRNTGDYSRYSYFGIDRQRSPSAQRNCPQNNHQQSYQNSNAYSSPQQASDAGHRSNRSGSPCVNNRLEAVAAKYEINDTLTRRLRMLQKFEIVVLCDDSGSMNTHVEDTQSTRWDELRSIVQIIIEISVVLDSNGIDVHFLNRHPVLHVTDFRHIQQSFIQRPAGATPLVPALRRIFQSAASKSSRSKKLLVFVATDGEPTDNAGNPDIRSLERLMHTERQSDTMHVVFLTCTDDKSSVAYLSEWDRTMINVDVIDDYDTEREEVRQMRGRQYPFSFGDYIVKALLGAVDPQMDSLDEPTNDNDYNK